MSELFKLEPPPWIPIREWEAFVEMRKRKGKRNDWTELSRDRAIKLLDDMRQRGVDIAEVLLICADFGWVGVEWGEREISKRSAHHSQRGDAPSKQLRALQSLQGAKR